MKKTEKNEIMNEEIKEEFNYKNFKAKDLYNSETGIRGPDMKGWSTVMFTSIRRLAGSEDFVDDYNTYDFQSS